MGSRGRGRPKKSVCGEDAEFFKVFLPHINSHQLLIPPDFLKDFKKTIKERVVLKGIGGKRWHVDVEETPDGVFLKNGWQSFVAYHSLKVGDFLVFRYDKCYSFVVKIFGSNGCKKEALDAKKVKVERETDEEREAKQMTSDERAQPDKEDHLLRGNERTMHSKMSSVWCEEGNELEERNVASQVSENWEESKNAECAYFVASPCRPRKYKLRIPDELINEYNIHLEPEMVLRNNSNGKEWPVNIFSLNDGPTFIGRGWLAFQDDNDVGLSDSCKFTFPTERSSRTIQVEILRGKANM